MQHTQVNGVGLSGRALVSAPRSDHTRDTQAYAIRTSESEMASTGSASPYVLYR